MVAPGFLQSPNVIRWLGSIEPAWTLLTVESFNALRREPSKENRALALASDLTDTEISLSPMARNMLLFLQRASVGDGLKLTGAGNLSRAVVAEMVDRFEWPEFDRAAVYRYRKVLNEPDFLPHFSSDTSPPRRNLFALTVAPSGRHNSGEIC